MYKLITKYSTVPLWIPASAGKTFNTFEEAKTAAEEMTALDIGFETNLIYEVLEVS